MKLFTATLATLFFVALAFTYGVPLLALVGLALYLFFQTHTHTQPPHPLATRRATIEICTVSQRPLMITAHCLDLAHLESEVRS